MNRPDFSIVALAKAVHRELRARRSEGARIAVTASMSRLLEHDPDYFPYRERRDGQRRPKIKAPRITTLIAIARLLGTTVGELLGENPHIVSARDRRRLGRIGRYLASRFNLQEEEHP